MKTAPLQSKNWKLLAMNPTCLEIVTFATILQICRFFVLYQPSEFLLVVLFIWYSQIHTGIIKIFIKIFITF